MSPRAVPSGQHDLPIRARTRQQLSVQLGPRERAAGEGDDAPAPLAHLAELERFAEDSFEAVDQDQRRIGEQVDHREASGRIVGVPLERRDGYEQPVGERQGGKQTVELCLAVGAVQPDRRCSVTVGRPSPEPNEVPVLRELGRGGGLGALASLDLLVRCAGRNLEHELDQELHHRVTVTFAAMNSRRALFTSSECVQAMLCGPPSTATSVQSAIRPAAALRSRRTGGSGPRCRGRPARGRRSSTRHRGSRSARCRRTRSSRTGTSRQRR